MYPYTLNWLECTDPPPPPHGTHCSPGPGDILGLHLGQPEVGVLQQLLDVLRVFRLQLELVLLHLGHGGVQLAGAEKHSASATHQCPCTFVRFILSLRLRPPSLFLNVSLNTFVYGHIMFWFLLMIASMGKL